MQYSELIQKVRELDPRFSVQENVNRPGLANIFFNNKNYDLPVVSSVEIPDEVNPAATYTFPGGQVARLWAWPEVEGRLKTFLEMEKSGKLDEDYAR